MSFDKVENAVLVEAKAEAEKIADRARKDSKEAIARFREEAEKSSDDAVRAAEGAAARETARKLGIARQEGRMSVLAAKNKVLDTLFSRAADKLRTLSEQEYRGLVEGLLKNLPQDIGGTLRIHPDDAAVYTRSLLDEVNKGRSESGKITGVVNDQKVARGFIIDGPNFTADFTIDTLLAKVREDMVGELAKELFES